jgi:hypothetical protein
MCVRDDFVLYFSGGLLFSHVGARFRMVANQQEKKLNEHIK